ncbi:hypothetical protein G7062_08015 [Erysipelothrix sp. HDW6C]|uniref:hypothetical protein n=1 Tax=Erysipelothrix sp. HDW6C TaxID=2714930 RepID=UPI00140E7407|nr:hypothetical protein [Erysipelothrix sp. HDW6C]QIK70239.1 hypothetical protein G7062_08015 [Erysipelothrix sp. HDW6C]
MLLLVNGKDYPVATYLVVAGKEMMGSLKLNNEYIKDIKYKFTKDETVSLS